jgi:hypothetical protein
MKVLDFVTCSRPSAVRADWLGLVPRKEAREDNVTARHAALREINYHLQSGWFEEGPSKGPVIAREGLKPLDSQHVRPACSSRGKVHDRANGQTGHLSWSSCRTGGRAR